MGSKLLFDINGSLIRFIHCMITIKATNSFDVLFIDTSNIVMCVLITIF